MPMNLVIREKRKEIGITQEQIADYLGVSAPAVSKWEKGATFPDVSLLPPLARILKIDLNTLLCFNEGMSKQEVAYFSTEVIDSIRKNGYKNGFAMAMEKIREYPNCTELIQSTAILLDGALIMYGSSVEDREVYENQIIALYERASKSDDDQVRNKAIYMLVSKYMSNMEYDKAQEMLDTLPERTELDKKQLQARLLISQDKLTDALVLLERKLLMELNEIQTILMSLVDVELKGENHENASYLAEICREMIKLFDLWDYSSFVAPLQVAIGQKNVKDSVTILKSMLSAMLIPWKAKNSKLYRHIPLKENSEDFGLQMLPTILSNLENNPEYVFLHSSAEFQQLIEQYRAKCGTLDSNISCVKQ